MWRGQSREYPEGPRGGGHQRGHGQGAQCPALQEGPGVSGSEFEYGSQAQAGYIPDLRRVKRLTFRNGNCGAAVKTKFFGVWGGHLKIEVRNHTHR